MTWNLISLTRDQVVARALAHLTFCERHPKAPRGTPAKPVEYRLDDSGRLGGDDPRASSCVDWSFGYRTPTSDCIGFALYCAGIARLQPGFHGRTGDYLNTDSVLADAHGRMFFFRQLLSGEAVKPGDLLVSPSTYLGGVRLRPGHIGVIVRPGAKMEHHAVIDCSPRHGKSTAIGFGYAWNNKCEVVRPLFYKETP